MKLLLRRWEALGAPRQALLAFPTLVVLLLAVHLAFFHRITFWRSVTYAVGEALVVTALLLLATATEQARRQRDACEQARDDEPPPAANQGS